MLRTVLHYGSLFTLVLFAVCASVVGQKAMDGVIVTGDVTNVVLCDKQDDAWIYRVTIKLHAKNVSTAPVIVSTADGLTDFYKLANTLDDLHAQGYSHIGWVTSDASDPKSVSAMPVKPFKVVAPNASVDINVNLRAVVTAELKTGATYIQIIAENWPNYSDAYTEKLRVAWKSHGSLWAHSLHSEPIAFVMPSPVKRVRCP